MILYITKLCSKILRLTPMTFRLLFCLGASVFILLLKFVFHQTPILNFPFFNIFNPGRVTIFVCSYSASNKAINLHVCTKHTNSQSELYLHLYYAHLLEWELTLTAPCWKHISSSSNQSFANSHDNKKRYMRT